MSLVGTTVGRIRIVELLGRGGMGEVFAGYDETLQRKVALKAIRDEKRLDAETKARFLREARMLSQLDHPGICRIHEYVEADDVDFLVLELIDGRSLKEAMSEELGFSFKLFIAERVADALVAAHAKGIAHRDLKPENVMLTREGGVKVLDFGLARPVDAELPPAGDGATGDSAGAGGAGGDGEGPPHAAGAPETEPEGGAAGDSGPWTRTVVMSGAFAAASAPEESDTAVTRVSTRQASDFVRTREGIVMGTVGYMSPEQARGERASVAGDMYSFGLLLQELFTGESPYEGDLKLMQLLLKVARAETRPVRGLDPELTELIERLEAHDPEARPSAEEAAERLRWIRGKPGRRLLRRIAAGLLLVLVVGGLKYTFDLREQRNLADQARQEAEAVVELLIDAFEVADPRQARGATVSAREILDAGAQRLARLRDQPRTQARVMVTIARVYRQLAAFEEALPLVRDALEIHRRVFGEDALETAGTLDLLANLYQDLGDFEQAGPLFQRALEIREKAAGPGDLRVAASLTNLGDFHRDRGELDRAEPLFLRALEIQEDALGGERPEVARSLNNLGNLYRRRGDYARAEEFLERSIAIQERVRGPDHPEVAISLNNLAMIHYQQGDAERALPLYLRTLEISEKVLGERHPNVATNLNNLAELYRATGEYGEAEPLYERALEIQEEALGRGHPALAITLSNFADLLSARGRGPRAEAFYMRAIAIQEEALGGDHPEVAITLNHLADLHHAGGDDERAEALYRRALGIQEQALDDGHPALAITLADLADLWTREGRFDDAGELFERALAIVEPAVATRPDARPARHRLAATLVKLGRLYRATGDEARALATWTAAVDVMAPLAGDGGLVAYLQTRALALLYLGRVDEARPLAARLLAAGWSDPDFLGLCRERGLESPQASVRPATISAPSSMR